jgi:hypothetical protein
VVITPANTKAYFKREDEMKNYDEKTLDDDIELVKRLTGTYDADCYEYYRAHKNVMLFVAHCKEKLKDT